jgi:cytoplasmic iron level regulating protein YaaA (DUF328/UPF0246 family)
LRILLPPSEGKTAPASGPPLDLGTLTHPELTPQRERILDVVERLGRGGTKTGLARLGIGPGLTDELERNADLRTAPTAPAAALYSGVLFQRLDLSSLSPAARVRAGERILVASALWGVVGLDDHIPAYRLSIGADLPRLPGLASFWRAPLAAVLPAEGLVVDCRSGGYAAAWRPAVGPLVEVRVVVERDGRRTVVSHLAKATRGDVARLLAEAPAAPQDPEAVAAILEAAGLRVELASADGPRRVLDVITT